MSAALPTIVRFHGTTDSPGSCCPHCGAEGRYTLVFDVDVDGERRRTGAMRGCVKLFPVAPIARAAMEIEKRIADRVKKGWAPSSWDTRAAEALDAFYAGTMTEDDALRAVERERAAATAWRRSRFGGR